MKKVTQHVGLAQQMIVPQHFCTGCSSWQKAQQSLTPHGDCLDVWIDPSGLLSVVSYFCSPSLNFYA